MVSSMDVTELQLTIALQEAFACYLAFLSHTQKLRESTLPRSGKGAETTDDVSTQQFYQSRVAGIESCLRFTGKIARRVRHWGHRPHEDDDEEVPEADVENSEVFEPDGPDTPYLDFFSGCLVEPITPFSPGPSHSGDEAASQKVGVKTSSQVIKLPPRHISRRLTSD